MTSCANLIATNQTFLVQDVSRHHRRHQRIAGSNFWINADRYFPRLFMALLDLVSQQGGLQVRVGPLASGDIGLEPLQIQCMTEIVKYTYARGRLPVVRSQDVVRMPRLAVQSAFHAISLIPAA
ncbi:hypothetical protein D9M69_380860 [compost metagenome]